jgi:hypothetical protein
VPIWVQNHNLYILKAYSFFLAKANLQKLLVITTKQLRLPPSFREEKADQF